MKFKLIEESFIDESFLFEQVLINLINKLIIDYKLLFKIVDNLLMKKSFPKYFLPFYTTRKDGAGIGLTLSKNIIEAHKLFVLSTK